MDCPFTLTIDPTNKVKEANEANNVIHGVCKKTYIDLAASNVEATANCNAKTISFKPVVTNLGTITHQGGFYWRIKTTSPSGKVCLNPGQGNVINQSVLVPQQVRIAPNTSYKPDSQICQSLPLENGTYALELWIGYGNEIYDDNRSNDYVRIERPVRCP
jgi:hypothetical protein